MDIDAILEATKGHTQGPWCVDSYADDPYVVTYPTINDRRVVTDADDALLDAAPALRAEVLRLREREAALVWLLGWQQQTWGAYVKRGDRKLAGMWYAGVSTAPPNATAPDPVALAKALGWGGVA